MVAELNLVLENWLSVVVLYWMRGSAGLLIEFGTLILAMHVGFSGISSSLLEASWLKTYWSGSISLTTV